MNRKAQVTIFVIIAIVLVAGIIGYFVVKGSIGNNNLPASFKPIEQYYLDCISDKVETGKSIMADQGGWINLPSFEPGSSFAPFSNQLAFQGIGIPYWYYVTNNGFVKEQTPSKTKMQQELAGFIEEEIAKCDFSIFEEQGFVIFRGDGKASVVINDETIDVTLDQELTIQREGDSARQTSHKLTINSKLGKMYNEAMTIYNEEKQTMFLENYALDTMRLYAPVDGIEISCAPKIWVPENVVSDLKNALENNIAGIKTDSNYYSGASKYYIINSKTDDAVNFIFNKNWPSRIEIWPVEGGVMKAEPVGNQEGLGVLGFCYVAYHFVYDVYIPVLVQVYDNQESFQFPVAVVIDKNKARQALEGEAVSEDNSFCQYKNQDMTIFTYDSKLNPVEADIGYKCFDTECDIGKTVKSESGAVLEEKFPQCVNGFVIARAEGYAEKKYMISTNEAGTADIILDKLYDVSINLELDGKEVDNAVVYFNSGDYGASLVWPMQKQVKLKEGQYDISMQAFKNSSLVFPATSQRKCVEVAKPGILGMLGQTSEQCFDINMPSQQLTNVLIGGGKTSDYFTEDRLANGKIKISGSQLPVASSLEQVQTNYELFSTKKIYVTDE